MHTHRATLYTIIDTHTHTWRSPSKRITNRHKGGLNCDQTGQYLPQKDLLVTADREQNRFLWVQCGLVDGGGVAGQFVDQLPRSRVPHMHITVATASGHAPTVCGPGAAQKILLERVLMSHEHLEVWGEVGHGRMIIVISAVYKTVQLTYA